MVTSNSDLDRSPIFQNMPPEQRSKFLKLVDYAEFPEGETILKEGRSTQNLWIILKGCCEVVKILSNGEEQQFDVLEPGAVFGEMSFFHPAPHSASIRAVTRVEVMRLSRGNYARLEETAPAAAHTIAFNTATVLAERLRKMDDWIRNLVRQPEAAQHRKEWREFRAKLYTDWEF